MQGEYAIRDGVGLSLLLRAAECLDRLAQARASIEAHGAIIETNGKLTANPAVKLERESHQTFLSAMRLLNLDSDRRRPIGRPARPVGATLETIEAIRNGARRW